MEVDKHAGANVFTDRDWSLPQATGAGEDPVCLILLDPDLVLPRLLRGRSASRELGGEITDSLLLLLDQDVEAFADLLNIGAEIKRGHNNIAKCTYH